MTTIEVDINGTAYTARVLPNEDSWGPAALRAIQQKFGKQADVWRWTIDGRQVTGTGDVARVRYKATIIGERNHGSHPVLAEARLWIDTRAEGRLNPPAGHARGR